MVATASMVISAAGAGVASSSPSLVDPASPEEQLDRQGDRPEPAPDAPPAEGAVDGPELSTLDVPVAAALGTYPCQGYKGIAAYNPLDEVLAGRFHYPGLPVTTISVGTNVNWWLDPYDNPSWTLWLGTLAWLGYPIEAARDGNTVALAHAVGVVQDFARDRPPSTWAADTFAEARAHRTQVLLCLREVVGPTAWLDAMLIQHGDYLVAHFSGYSNHGLDESIALLGVGCVLGRTDFATLARQRTDAMIPVMIDKDGASNEQAVGYQEYVWRRVGVALTLFSGCGYPLAPLAAERHALMPTFMAHATNPVGNMVQIGDTVEEAPYSELGPEVTYTLTGGTSGTAPRHRVAIYRAGYVFGRDTWAPFLSSSHYTLRYGPGRALHGHMDGGSLTLWARGRQILVDSGHVGYEQTTYRSWLISPYAHNVLTLPGYTFYPSRATALTRWALYSRGDFYEFSDSSWGGRTRLRSVLVAHYPSFAVIYDRLDMPAPTLAQQLWHLPRDFTTVPVGRSRAVAASSLAKTSVHLVQVVLPGQALPAGATAVVRGRTSPSYQGWLSPAPLTRLAADTVVMSRRDAATRMLTVVVPARPGAAVSASAVRGSDGWYVVTVGIGSERYRVRLSPGGWISYA